MTRVMLTPMARRLVEVARLEAMRRFEAAAGRGGDRGAVRLMDDYELTAAEMLICAPAFWLRDEEFAARFIRSAGDAVVVAWREAVEALDSGQLAAPVRACRLLRLAASMAAGVPVSLRDCVRSGGPAGGWIDTTERVDWLAAGIAAGKPVSLCDCVLPGLPGGPVGWMDATEWLGDPEGEAR